MPTGKAHYRISYRDAIWAHEVALSLGPGIPGILNANGIKGAITRPYNGYYRPIRKKGAALVQSVCGNHGFADGNKRTAVILLYLLLDRSEYYLYPHKGEDLNEAVENMVVAVANSGMDFDDIAEWLKLRIRKKPSRQ